MKAGVLAAAVLLLLPGQAAAASSKPQRIMSLKICTDQLLMDLVAPLRIVSVTFLAQEPAALRWWPGAKNLRVNYGSAEEILAARPDLILTDSFTAPALKPLLARSGAKVVEIPLAENFANIRKAVRLTAKAVGEEARGEALIARMNADLRDIAAKRPKHGMSVVQWGEGGYVPGTGGLFDAVLTAIGVRNAERGSFGFYDVESLLVKNPDALVYANTYDGMVSLRDHQSFQAALMRRYQGRRVSYDSLYDCGVPNTARAAKRLQAALADVTP